MQNPFPGMNPYLEQPGLWPQVHSRLIVAIADEITPQVVPTYRVSIEERIYTSAASDALVGIADVAVAQRGDKAKASLHEHPTEVASQQATLPRRVKVPMAVEVKERFLEVRLVQTDAVVCVIEILSPTNKRTGEGRSAYETKRQKILSSVTHLIEIDLLRSGAAMPVAEPRKEPYSILVSRSFERPEAALYEFGLREPIPSFPVPLQQGDREPAVTLQRVLDEVYRRARFDLAIDYGQVVPGLTVEEREWVETVLE